MYNINTQTQRLTELNYDVQHQHTDTQTHGIHKTQRDAPNTTVQHQHTDSWNPIRPDLTQTTHTVIKPSNDKCTLSNKQVCSS